MDNLSMDIFHRYSGFTCNFKLVSRKVSGNGTIVSDYECAAPMKDHTYHLQVEECGLENKGHYSFI